MRTVFNRRSFIKTGLIFVPGRIFAQAVPISKRGAFFQNPATASAANNITVAHANGKDNGGVAQATIAYDLGGVSVTNGNVIFVGVGAVSSDGHALTFATGQLTKTAGTATIGTVSLDQQQNPTTTIVGCALYRVPVTGSGTLTLTWNSGGNPYFLIIEELECANVNTGSLGPGGVASGNSTTASTGSITTTVPGIIVYVSNEQSTVLWTRTFSDTLVYKDDDGAAVMTGIMQYKLQSSSPNTLTSSLEPGGVQWYVAYQQYKSN